MNFEKVSDSLLISECGCYLVMRVVNATLKQVCFEAWGEALIGEFGSGLAAREACTQDYAGQRVSEFYF